MCVVEDTGAAADYGLSIAKRLPGKSKPGREVVVLSLPECATQTVLSGFHHAPGRRVERRYIVVLFSRRREYFPAQSQIQSEVTRHLVVILSEEPDRRRLLIPVRRVSQRTLRGSRPTKQHVG